MMSKTKSVQQHTQGKFKLFYLLLGLGLNSKCAGVILLAGNMSQHALVLPPVFIDRC